MAGMEPETPIKKAPRPINMMLILPAFNVKLGRAESRRGSLRTESGKMTPNMTTLMMIRINHKDWA